MQPSAPSAADTHHAVAAPSNATTTRKPSCVRAMDGRSAAAASPAMGALTADGQAGSGAASATPPPTALR